ncbi:MAG: hypothetical protein HEEMFOPI_00356 [Holosporales bacterium]
MERTIQNTLKTLFSSKKIKAGALIAAFCCFSSETKAVNFAGYGSAQQAIAYSAAVSSTGITALTAADSNNFTQSSTVSSAHTGLFGLSATTTTVLTIPAASPLYFSGVAITTTNAANASTMNANVTMAAADLLSGAVIQSFSAAQLAALLNAGLNNPDSYRSIPLSLTGVSTSVLTKANTNYIECIPKYVRAAVMATALTALTVQPSWGR